VVGLEFCKYIDCVGFVLIIHHLVMDTTKKNQVLWFIESLDGKCWVVTGPLALSRNDVTFFPDNRLIVSLSGVNHELTSA